MVSNRTYIDPDGMRSSADRIGPLLDDLSPFHQVSATKTSSGNFPAAHALDSLVGQRGDGLFQHAQSVKLVCHDIKDGLDSAVDTFQQTDGSNAGDLDRSLYHDVNVTRVNSRNHTKESADANSDA